MLVSEPADGLDGPITVLLVEDDQGDAYLVQELLRPGRDEFVVIWARTMAEALAKLGPTVDCVLLDLGLPDTEGLDALRTVVALEQDPAVVVLTGFDDHPSGAQALALGAQDYLQKGFVDEETLARSVRYAIARKQAEDAARELREAALLQSEKARLERGLLPRPLIANPAITLATRYEAGGGRALLGGDFFDAVELEDGTVRIVIGDVSGHGPDEAALGAALRVAWRALVVAGQRPDAGLPVIERILAAERSTEEVFASVCDIELTPDLRQARIRTAGHPSPLLWMGDAICEPHLPHRGAILGSNLADVGSADGWQPDVVELGPQCTLIAFTDGIIEGRRAEGEERLGSDGLADIAALALKDAGSLEEAAEAMLAAAEAANGAPLQDDVALVILSTARRWTT